MFDTLPRAELNERQRAAVVYEGRSLLVVAGAGSGKTKTLVCRVAHLLKRGVPPERILLLTFTRRAAREMLRRAEGVSGRREAARVCGGTFHSVGNRLLRRHGRAVGVPERFTVMDAADAAEMMSLVRSELGLGEKRRRFPRKETLATIYSRVVNAGSPLSDVLGKHFPWCAQEIESVRDVFARYTERKRDQAVLDYDDLLLYWRALAAAPTVGEVVASSFDHILVDEYQDTNAVQADVLVSMRTRDASITAVGDDAQAIYSFRAATVTNILEFPSRHPETCVIKLEQNYRSTQPILRVSNAVIAGARRRYTKELWSTREGGVLPSLVTCRDEAEQSDRVCRDVLEQRERGVELKRQAVLFRAGHHSAPLELELARRNIPFVKFGGLRFTEAAHVKDLLGLLRVVENPWDELAWFRSLQLLDGVGPATARRLLQELGVTGARVDHDNPADSPLTRLLADPSTLPPSASEEGDAFCAALADCARTSAPGPQVERLRGFYEPVLWRAYDGAPARAADLEQLERIAAGYASRQALLADLTLDPPTSTSDLAGPPHLDEDYLCLSTIHSAKGAEWDVVNVIHAADGMIPSDMALGDEEGTEEELRLLYVAMTRARQRLNVFFPLRYYHRRAGLEDEHSLAQLTRFIPREIHHLFEQRGPDPTSVDEPDSAIRPGDSPVIDYLAALWKA